MNNKYSNDHNMNRLWADLSKTISNGIDRIAQKHWNQDAPQEEVVEEQAYIEDVVEKVLDPTKEDRDARALELKQREEDTLMIEESLQEASKSLNDAMDALSKPFIWEKSDKAIKSQKVEETLVDVITNIGNESIEEVPIEEKVKKPSTIDYML